jgi:hypothetical protein
MSVAVGSGVGVAASACGCGVGVAADVMVGGSVAVVVGKGVQVGGRAGRGCGDLGRRRVVRTHREHRA